MRNISNLPKKISRVQKLAKSFFDKFGFVPYVGQLKVVSLSNKKLGKEIYSKKATQRGAGSAAQAAQSRLGENMGVFFVTRKWANNWDPLRTFLKYRCFAEKLTGQTLYFNDKVYCPKSDMLNLLQIGSQIEFVVFCRSNIKHKSTILCFLLQR